MINPHYRPWQVQITECNMYIYKKDINDGFQALDEKQEAWSSSCLNKTSGGGDHYHPHHHHHDGGGHHNHHHYHGMGGDHHDDVDDGDGE